MVIILASVPSGCGGGVQIQSAGPPLLCRLPVAHASVPSITQERAQLDRANEILQFCMAQWETSRRW